MHKIVAHTIDSNTSSECSTDNGPCEREYVNYPDERTEAVLRENLWYPLGGSVHAAVTSIGDKASLKSQGNDSDGKTG